MRFDTTVLPAIFISSFTVAHAETRESADSSCAKTTEASYATFVTHGLAYQATVYVGAATAAEDNNNAVKPHTFITIDLNFFFMFYSP